MIYKLIIIKNLYYTCVLSLFLLITEKSTADKIQVEMANRGQTIQAGEKIFTRASKSRSAWLSRRKTFSAQYRDMHIHQNPDFPQFDESPNRYWLKHRPVPMNDKIESTNHVNSEIIFIITRMQNTLAGKNIVDSILNVWFMADNYGT